MTNDEIWAQWVLEANQERIWKLWLVSQATRTTRG
jgi:hypothetical protein